MAKKSLKTDDEVKAAVDGLLGEFGLVGEAEADFAEGALPKVKNGESGHHVASSPDADALWGGIRSESQIWPPLPSGEGRGEG